MSVTLWDEGDPGDDLARTCGVSWHRETRRTEVYRGAELVPDADGGGWHVWWIATCGREGFVGRAGDRWEARAMVDGLWADG